MRSLYKLVIKHMPHMEKLMSSTRAEKCLYSLHNRLINNSKKDIIQYIGKQKLGPVCEKLLIDNIIIKPDSVKPNSLEELNAVENKIELIAANKSNSMMEKLDLGDLYADNSTLVIYDDASD